MSLASPFSDTDGDVMTMTITARGSDANRVLDVVNLSVTEAPFQSEPETMDIVARYNGDGGIDKPEYPQARQDFVTGTVSYSEFMEVYQAHLSAGQRQRRGCLDVAWRHSVQRLPLCRSASASYAAPSLTEYHSSVVAGSVA